MELRNLTHASKVLYNRATHPTPSQLLLDVYLSKVRLVATYNGSVYEHKRLPCYKSGNIHWKLVFETLRVSLSRLEL